MKDSFFSMLFRQKYIVRWSLMRSAVPENLSQHSMETAVIAHALALIGVRVFGRAYDPQLAATLGLFHDAPEVLCGDLPTPVKYFSPEMRASYAELEAQSVSRLLGSLPEVLREDYARILAPDLSENGENMGERRLVKAADKLCAYIKCLEEQSLGNREFSSAAHSIEDAMKELRCEELDWFRENLLPAFLGTLDDMC